MRPWIVCAAALLLAVVSSLGAAAQTGAGSPAEAGAGPGATLWRGGDAEAATQMWMATLQQDAEISDEERARLAYNLGVAAHGAGDPLLATAWFTSALEHAPRHGDAAFNLEIARAEAGLPPRASDDLTGAALGFLGAFTRSESEWLAIGGALLLALFALLESFRGGAWTRWALVVLLVQPLFFGPLLGSLLEPEGIPVMVVADSGSDVYAVPASTAVKVGTLASGAIVQRLDALPGWVNVRYEGEDRWVRADDVLALRWPAEDVRESPN